VFAATAALVGVSLLRVGAQQAADDGGAGRARAAAEPAS